VNPADRQPSGNLGNSRVIARKNVELQLSCGFDRQAGVLPSEPGSLRFAAAIDPEQNQRRGATSELCGMVRFSEYRLPARPWWAKIGAGAWLGATFHGRFMGEAKGPLS